MNKYFSVIHGIPCGVLRISKTLTLPPFRYAPSALPGVPFTTTFSLIIHSQYNADPNNYQLQFHSLWQPVFSYLFHHNMSNLHLFSSHNTSHIHLSDRTGERHFLRFSIISSKSIVSSGTFSPNKPCINSCSFYITNQYKSF